MQVFVVGAARSGTTRLKTAISDVLDLPRTSEGHFFPIARDLDQAIDEYFTRLRGRASEKTMVWAVDDAALRRGVHAAIREQFDAVAGRSFVEKTPGTQAVLALPMVAEQWPEAKIVFARRRGIENIISVLYKFEHRTFDDACRDWTAAMGGWLALDPAIRARSIEIDQMDMARAPEETAARLGAYLGLNAAGTASLGTAFTKRAHSRTNTRVSSMEELRQDPIPLGATPWTEAQRATFATVCGPMMAAFGYPLD